MDSGLLWLILGLCEQGVKEDQHYAGQHKIQRRGGVRGCWVTPSALRMPALAVGPQFPSDVLRTVLDCFDQPCEQSSPPRQLRSHNRLVWGVGAFADRAQAIQGGNPQAGGEIPVRAAADSDLVYRKAQAQSDLSGKLK